MAIKCGLKLNVPDDYHWTADSVKLFKEVAEEEEALEAVFCEKVDGIHLIRSLKTENQNLFKLIEEAIQNSANSEGEVDRPAEAVGQEIEPVFEGCLEAAANEQLTARNSVAEKIALMESLIHARSNSPTSPSPNCRKCCPKCS